MKMITQTGVVWATVCLLGFVSARFVLAEESSSAKNPGAGSHRLLMNYDMTALWFPVRVAYQKQDVDAEAMKRMLEEIVDEHARARIDTLVQCVWVRFRTHMPDCKSAESVDRLPRYEKMGLKRLNDGGFDLVQILLDRSRKRGMRFLAGMRMNDRHGVSQRTKFYQSHAEWHLQGFPGGLDYKHEGVRRAILAFIEEFLGKYDVDGIEFDYMRWCHVFRPSEAAKNAPLLTAFMRRTRRLLDQASRKRGRERLLLGVRIPQTIEECDKLGFDVAEWIKDGLADYVCPSDFFYTDFNARTEEFVKQTKGTHCKVYPSLHPVVTQQNDVEILSGANYRAAARNFAASGAHGFSAYNYQYNWCQMIAAYKFGPKGMWPKSLGFLSQLSNAESIGKADRHYLYHPLWGNSPCPTGARKNDRIILKRTNPTARRAFRFRLAEDLTNESLSAVLEFKATGMTDGDRLELDINGKKIAPAQITRTYDADGQSPEKGRKLPAFHLYRFPLTSPPAVFGDNRLGARLARSAGKEDVDIQEVEVKVKVRLPGARE